VTPLAVASALKNRERHRRIVIEIGIRGIIESGEFDGRDIAESHHRVGCLLDDDGAELIRIIQAAERLHRDLKGPRAADWRLIEDARGDLNILALQRGRDVASGQPERLQAIGIKPYPHRVIAAAENRDRSDAVDPRQRIGDFERGVVGNEQRIARFIGRIQMHDHHQVGRRLAHGDADIAHVTWQPRLRDRDPVLNLNLSDIEISAEIEGDLN
jgi:hypothetical protein